MRRKRIRTKFPAIVNGEVKKYTFEEITEDLDYGQKVTLEAIQTEIQARMINIKKDIYIIGKLLSKAKRTLYYGMFTPWLKETFGDDLPYGTAHFYMKVYEVFKDHPKTIQYVPSKYLLMITSRQFPAEIVKVLNEYPEKINKQGLIQINELYDLFKEGTIGGSAFLELTKEQIKLGIDIWKGREEHRLNINMRHSLEFGAGDILKRIDTITDIAKDMQWTWPYDPKNPEHKKLMKKIDETIKKLQELKLQLESRKGIFRPISTEDGIEYLSNI